jgi:hypothetical protein
VGLLRLTGSEMGIQLAFLLTEQLERKYGMERRS